MVPKLGKLFQEEILNKSLTLTSEIPCSIPYKLFHQVEEPILHISSYFSGQQEMFAVQPPGFGTFGKS